LKVWIVDQNANLMYYGYSLCMGLAHSGCDVTLVTKCNYQWENQPHPQIKISEVFSAFSTRLVEKYNFLQTNRVLRTGIKALEYPLSYLSFIRLYFKEKPDIIHFQYALIPIVDSLVFKFLKVLGLPCVFTVHNIVQPRKIQINDYFLKLSYKCISHFVVHSNANKTEFSHHYRLAPDRIRVIPHGNYNAYITDHTLTRDTARQSLKVASDRHVILFFGIIFKFKGLEYLLRALSKIPPDSRPILMIAGKPSDGFDSYQEEIDQLGIGDDVCTRLEFIPNDELQLYFTATDLVILPYTRITQSGVMLTAFSFGKPVVATRVGSFPETIIEGKNGYLAEPQDVDSLSTAISRALADPAHLEDMSRFSKEYSDREFNWDSIAQQTLSLYQEAKAAHE
jgi:D-inositol-3-phosphate glycosyltransferase